MLYVFCCNSASCARQPSDSWCAFSIQADQEDTAALCENDEAEDDDVVQVSALLPSELPLCTFPPCYVSIDEEPAKEVIVPTDVEAEMIRMAEENARAGANEIKEEDLRELEAVVDLKDKKADYYYEKFRARVARAPTQVMRYHQRSPAAVSSGTTSTSTQQRPLFMNPDKVKRFLTIPACTHCGAALVHELQLMPTVLYYLQASHYIEPGRSSGDEGVDFATATVYVCSQNCARQHSRGVYLRREFVCVEEAPTIQDDAATGGEDTRKDLRQLLSEGLDTK